MEKFKFFNWIRFLNLTFIQIRTITEDDTKENKLCLIKILSQNKQTVQTPHQILHRLIYLHLYTFDIDININKLERLISA